MDHGWPTPASPSDSINRKPRSNHGSSVPSNLRPLQKTVLASPVAEAHRGAAPRPGAENHRVDRGCIVKHNGRLRRGPSRQPCGSGFKPAILLRPPPAALASRQEPAGCEQPTHRYEVVRAGAPPPVPSRDPPCRHLRAIKRVFGFFDERRGRGKKPPTCGLHWLFRLGPGSQMSAFLPSLLPPHVPLSASG